MFPFHASRVRPHSVLGSTLPQRLQTIPSLPTNSPNTLISSQITPKRFAKTYVYALGIPKHYSRTDVERYFRLRTEYLKHVRLLRDTATDGRSGMALLLYYRRSAASRCVEKLNGANITPDHKLSLARSLVSLIEDTPAGNRVKHELLSPLRKSLYEAKAGPDIFQIKTSRVLYVGNIPFQFTKKDISAKLGAFGEIHEVKKSTSTKGYAHVIFKSFDSAKLARETLDGQDWGGRKMYVKYAYDKYEINNIGLKPQPQPLIKINHKERLKMSPAYRGFDDTGRPETEAYAKLKKRSEGRRRYEQPKSNIISPGSTLKLPGIGTHSSRVGALKSSHTYKKKGTERPLNDKELCIKLGLSTD